MGLGEALRTGRKEKKDEEKGRKGSLGIGRKRRREEGGREKRKKGVMDLGSNGGKEE